MIINEFKVFETKMLENKLYNLAKQMDGKIIDDKELDKPIAKELKLDKSIEIKKYKTIDEALKDASDEEKNIYENSNLEKGEINGRECLKRTDIDYDEKDAFGETNLEKMERGAAPIKDNKQIELHHIGQDMDSPLAELTKEEHMKNGNDTILHDKQKESTIDRNEFKKEREEHWKGRAEEIRKERGED